MIEWPETLLSVLLAAEEGTFDNFDWGIHAITIPGVLLFGIFLGWSLRERKIAQDEARQEIKRQRAAAEAKASAAQD